MLHKTSIYFFIVSSRTIDENHSNENIKFAGMISKKINDTAIVRKSH